MEDESAGRSQVPPCEVCFCALALELQRLLVFCPFSQRDGIAFAPNPLALNRYTVHRMLSQLPAVNFMQSIFFRAALEGVDRRIDYIFAVRGILSRKDCKLYFSIVRQTG
jgi:hypothetical protein